MTAIMLCTVVGARPQFVKAAAVARSLRGDDRFEEILVHTGQHYDADMSQVFFDELELPAPQRNLGVGPGSHATQTAKMLERLDGVLVDLNPDVVLVYGDTNSTLAAALVAAKRHVPVAHVEAGLRSYNPTMPEEINRRLTDHVADLLFCPSEHSAENLRAEGIHDGVFVTGDVMLEAMMWALPSEDDQAAIRERRGITAGEYALATLHRAENVDHPSRLHSIIEGLGEVAADLPVLLPLHPRAAGTLDGVSLPMGVEVMAPVGHPEMLALAAAARIGLTDSGGLQKELYWLGVPCVTMRDETEWVETVEAGWNRLAGADASRIAKEAASLLEEVPESRPPIYGTGDASVHVLDSIADWYGR